jgi:hypothetical protein
LDAIEYVDFDDLIDDFMDLFHPESASVVYNVNLTDVTKVKPNFELLHSLFRWAAIETMQCTIDDTTQLLVANLRYAESRLAFPFTCL